LCFGYTVVVTTSKYILVTLATIFFVISSIGVSYIGMSMGASGQMSGCPLMGVPALCHMSPLEHAFTLQNMLTAVPFSGMFALLVSILLALAITLLASIWKDLGILFEPVLRPPSRARELILRHSLQEAFSNGILNSKAF
jgi:hypothetical protein